ncbi:MAG TPA: hypothetical protein PK156_16575 [Polyangium sp.]|nr:hypothetical protein [Polyangium sp.]
MPLANAIVGIKEGNWYKVGENAASMTIAAVIAAKKARPKMGPHAPSGTPAHRLYALVN